MAKLSNLKLLKRSKKLRKNATDAEIYLWQLLKNRFFHGYKFRRQHIIEPYIVDFICIKKKLIIELDGGQHLQNQKYDNERSKFLMLKGYIILRFWNNMIFKDTEAVLETILNTLTQTLSRK